jgi:glycosyltransferase involved in cell wall biosynthesis
VIKSINGDRNLRDLEKLRYAAAGRPDIIIIDGYLTHDRKDAMMAICDCYVSLHRSEGFGLTMAEAMSIAKPVIATRYGGNLEFMSETNSFLCGFRMCRVGEGNEPYPEETEWSDPDIVEAASIMRHVYENPVEASARGKRAQADVAAHHSTIACARFLTERFARIEEKRRSGQIHAPHGDKTAKPIVPAYKTRVRLDDAFANLDMLRGVELQLENTAKRLARLAHSDDITTGNC